MNTTKTLIAGAAVAGLMTGSMAVRAYAAGEPNSAGVSLQMPLPGENVSLVWSAPEELAAALAALSADQLASRVAAIKQ